MGICNLSLPIPHYNCGTLKGYSSQKKATLTNGDLVKVGSNVLFSIDDNEKPNIIGEVVVIGEGNYHDMPVSKGFCVLKNQKGKQFIGKIDELILIKKEQNNERKNKKVRRRNSTVIGAVRSRRIAIQSGAGRAKCKGCNI